MGRWPLLMRVGLGVFGVGGLADVVYHALPAGSLADPVSFWAHLVTPVGMILTMLGIFIGRRWKQPELQTVSKGPVLKISKEV